MGKQKDVDRLDHGAESTLETKMKRRQGSYPIPMATGLIDKNEALRPHKVTNTVHIGGCEIQRTTHVRRGLHQGLLINSIVIWPLPIYYLSLSLLFFFVIGAFFFWAHCAWHRLREEVYIFYFIAFGVGVGVWDPVSDFNHIQ